MSKQTDLMELDKCIISRLWYVATIVHREELIDRCRHHRDVKKLKNLIASCAEQGLDEQKWIAYNLSSQIDNDEEAIRNLSHEEFVCTLKLLDTRIPQNAREELQRLFEAVTAAVQKTDVPHTCQLSQETLLCLQINMLEYPTLINWIIEKLLCICLPTSFTQSDLFLQEVYFTSIKKLLESLPTKGHEAKTNDTISFGFQEKATVLQNEFLGVLLSILSKISLADANEDEMLSWLFPALLEKTNPDDIALALYSRKNLKLFQAWHEFLDDTYARSDVADKLESVLKIVKIMFTLNENSGLSLNANEIFKRMLQRRAHWLTDIFDICCTLLINERYEEVEKIITISVLKNFWLPLLFKLLKDYPTARASASPEKCENSAAICGALRFVLKKLKLETCHDEMLERLTRTLETHLNVLNWILENNENTISSNNLISSNINSSNFSVKYILNLLQSHSVLAVLKMTSNIHAKPYEAINTLLSDTDSSRSTFQAYHTMLNALKGILACEFYNERYDRVAEYLNEMEKSLGSLFPLDLRVRVIENIFSMLFLRYEDFSESDSGSDVDEEDSNLNTKNNALTRKNSVEPEIGFLCNKYAMREILGRLKRSVVGANLEYFEQKQDHAFSLEMCEDLEKNMASLKKAIVDATWRLELLTSLDFVERLGLPDVDARKLNIFNDGPVLFRDEQFGLSAASKNKMMFYKACQSSSDESEFIKSDFDGSSETGSQSNTTSNRRRKRSKNPTSPMNEVSGTVSKDSKKRERTLNSMLASKESLVLQCLWKSDYDRASQVIEMFGLKNSRLDGEILFSRAIRKFRKEMRTQWTISDSVDSPDGVSEQTMLENIRKAVQDGFQTSRTTSQIETFLAAQESSVRLLNLNSTSTKEILTMASMDLALTLSHTNQDSINLSDVTIKYLKSCKKFVNTRYHVFFENIYELLHENKYDLTMRQILCDARIPLTVKEAREKNDYWLRLTKKLESFEQSIDESENNCDELTNDGSTNPFDENFQDIIAMCKNSEFYLARIHAHLKILRTIVLESYETFGENTRLLETSMDTYIGDQIFRLNVKLEDIESIASRLRVNLVHSILVNCCPKLSCFRQIRRHDIDNWGFIILNKGRPENDVLDRSFHEPNKCVIEILSELVQTIREEITPHDSKLRYSEAKELSIRPKIRRVLEKTQSLATLDLSNLSFGHHTLVFFINVWNLLMIHAFLEIWSKDPPFDDLHHEISLGSIGYDIGDLGTVSLATLRTKLLGRSLFSGSRYFSQTEELNEPAWQDLDVPYEPRVVFAMINEYEDSPMVQIYGLKTLDDDLHASMIDYIAYYGNHEKKFQRNSEIMTMPQLVKLYDDLSAKRSSMNSDERINNVGDENAGIVDNNRSQKSFRYSYELTFSYNEESTSNRDVNKQIERPRNEFPWHSRVVKSSLLQYLEGHCWLLSYLVQRIHEESPTILDSNCENLGRIAALENLLKSNWTNHLKYLFENNETVAGLRKIAPTKKFWDALETLLANNETTKCLEILNALPDSLMLNNIEIQRLRDKILAKLVILPSDRKISETMRYVYQIKDVQILAQVILENANDLSVKVCQQSLMHVLSHVEKEKLPAHCASRMNEILCRVTVFHKMLPYCTQTKSEDDDCWHNVVYHTEKTNPVRIVKSLIDAKQYELCLEWLQYQAVSSEIHSLITQDLLIGLLTNGENDFKHPLKLLQALPIKKSLTLCNGVIGKLESIQALRFVVGYLQDNTSSSENAKYLRCSLGIDILEQLDLKERRFYIHLIEQPLLMLEQLLMNCRFDSLQRIVVAARENLDKFNIYANNFDETVRFYAKKSLDFRVAVQNETIDKIKDASVSSNKSQNGDFVMPINIPTKEEWVPNDQATECSCCRVVIFSMFNRRHHCRRCGRVVCGTCSPQRMTLPIYPNSVPVRVCNDCKRQTLLQLQAAPSTPSSEIFDCWRLNVDETHNKTLREEFSFENAPNISLCLAILNLHSDHVAYSNFLLDRCDEMKSLLRPDSKGRVNPEIDHGLIIKMIRSLLVAAKVKCAELGLNSGLTHCDRFLSQVDLIATLVNSDCSYLIPRIDKDDHLDDHTLRRLRDMLTEKEQWTIALDVSTKTGLDTQGVWAAWGTACLKVGYYERARDKFVHCLDKVLREDSEDWVMLSYPGESYNERNKRLVDSWNSNDDPRRRNTNSKSHEGLKNRPSKDPPLLTEILQILDRTNPNDHYSQHNTRAKFNGAQEILNTLSSLKAISQGHYTIGQSSLGTKNFRYQESLYYLLMYGSFNSILGFFVRHGEYDKCLAYILENDVEPELFMNSVFLPCLKNGCMMNLCESMRSKDPSLLTYKKYLMHTCHSLERKQLLHTLHQLQLFMKDYVRASMTCIRFYITDATTYGDLCSRTHLLVEAQKHLESELRIENFGKKRRKSVSSSFSGQNSLTLEMDPIEIDRHMNTISRQMEIAKFLGKREQEGRTVSEFMNKLSCMDTEGSSSRNVPTLFGNQLEKTHLAVLAILCGRDVEEGFGIAFRIMQDYNLRPQKIYSLVGHMLALDRKIGSIEQLIKCCRSSGAPNSSAISDRVLAHCVKLLLDRSRADSNPSPKDQIDTLIRIITDVELKIESYIESRQLKAAYLLAVKHSRAQDIRKILKEADRLGQLAIKSICTKWLQQTQKSRGDV